MKAATQMARRIRGRGENWGAVAAGPCPSGTLTITAITALTAITDVARRRGEVLMTEPV
jgi:hypothetical protein